jgi:hypothetical protein
MRQYMIFAAAAFVASAAATASSSAQTVKFCIGEIQEPEKGGQCPKGMPFGNCGQENNVAAALCKNLGASGTPIVTEDPGSAISGGGCGYGFFTGICQ